MQREAELQLQRLDELSWERNKIRNRLRREKDPEKISELKAERNRLTEDISSVRKDLHIAEFTLERSKDVKRDIEIERAACAEFMGRNSEKNSWNRNRWERDVR